MRIQNVFLVTAILVIALLIGAATASSTQINSGTITGGSGNSQNFQNYNGVYNDHATYTGANSYVTSSYIGGTSNYYSVQGSSVQQLAKMDIVMDRVLMANQVLAIPINTSGNQTFLIQTGTPVAVYTIGDLDPYKVNGRESMMTYDPIYNVMRTGDVVPVDMVPYYTSDCHITTSAGAYYLVIDNRYYPSDAEVQIGEPHSSEEL